MSELLQVELIDSNRLLKREPWSSFSFGSGRFDLEGQGRATARGRGEVVDQSNGTCNYASDWICMEM